VRGVHLLIVGVQQGSPKIVVILVIANFLWAMLEPVGQGHVAVGQINSIGSLELGRDRILLGQDQAHDFAQLDVVDEEADMDGVRWELGGSVWLVFNEIVFGDHFDVRVFRIDTDRAAQSDSHRSISGEQGPPNASP